MMNSDKKTGSFSKIRKLIAVLEKCNGNSAVGGKGALISPKAAKALACFGLILLTVALFFGCYFLEPIIAAVIAAVALGWYGVKTYLNNRIYNNPAFAHGNGRESLLHTLHTVIATQAGKQIFADMFGL